MSEERYIAAIEISSSKVIGAIGRVHDGGQVDIIAVEQEKCVETVRYGIIQNLEETSTRLSRVLDRLMRRPAVSPRRITGVFIGLSGRSLRSIPTTVRLTLPDETEIDDAIIARLRSDALNIAIDNTLEVVDGVPRCYRIGTLETTSPKGAIGNEIVADFDIVVCRPEVKRNITRVVRDKLGLRIEGFVVTPLAVGHLILTEHEKRLGCMLVDMGAETTTVSIYRKNALFYLATLPFGGRNLTRDIQSLSILEDKAEEIKITSGCAIAPDTPSTLNLNGVKVADVINHTVARSQEIMANITEQVTYAQLKEKDLPGGLICIGGAVKLNGMTDLMARETGLQVRIGRLPGYVVIEDIKGQSAEITQVASVLYAGATLTEANCLEIPRREEIPVNGNPDTEEEPEEKIPPRKPQKESNPNSLFSRLRRGLGSIFSNPEEEDDSLLE
ncbi:MAG: hypothetical protein HDR80_09350 [Bacteroides sp.]|nr:hypothetical protein [Bacteroides sp.]